MENVDTRRLFVALDVKAPMEDEMPDGRLLLEEFRHMTLLFLGKVDFAKAVKCLQSFSCDDSMYSPVGLLDDLIFLPQDNENPNVAAYHVDFGKREQAVNNFQKDLFQHFETCGFDLSQTHKQFLPHVTIARNPKDKNSWKSIKKPLPALFDSMHLYESLGHSNYKKHCLKEFSLAFKPLSHTADIAFLVKGKDFNELFEHAEMALAFEFTPLCKFTNKHENVSSLNEVIQLLNRHVTHSDIEFGAPFKAVSYHGTLNTVENHLEWEMIIDV